MANWSFISVELDEDVNFLEVSYEKIEEIL